MSFSLAEKERPESRRLHSSDPDRAQDQTSQGGDRDDDHGSALVQETRAGLNFNENEPDPKLCECRFAMSEYLIDFLRWMFDAGKLQMWR